METVDELVDLIEGATVEGFRGRLLARGEARAIIRSNGIVPADAPPLGPTLDTDLAEYGFSLLRAALALRETGERSELARSGFERAANAFEALARNGSPDEPTRGFIRVLAATGYHLAGFSAIAYSLFSQGHEDDNFSPAEQALSYLILRNLDGLREHVRVWLRDPERRDDHLARELADEAIETEEVVSVVLNGAIARALAMYDFALQTGDDALVEKARAMLMRAQSLASTTGSVSMWWLARLTLNVIDDLWGHSLQRRLPIVGPNGSKNFPEIRGRFLANLYARKSAEVELWPSQLEAADRALDLTDDLVVALPTSAGKTRIAEIAALMALSTGSRVLLVTPLRALSAQTELSFRRTFAPLGFSVSSLYGAGGMSAGDEDALRSKHIIIATPEKLDFALRNDPTLINDVGLIVLDEGHLIGPSEREVRYEILVQRLLRRRDAGQRRIVCLSAILPDGQQLEDLTAWVRSDIEGEPIRSSWRPTRQRYGMVTWQGNGGRLAFDLEADGPFITRFVEERPASAPRRTPFPRNNVELTLATAWTFADQGKRTLIFCTQRNHVESYATKIIDLHNRGLLPKLLDPESDISRALEIGTEWLGSDHPAVKCLRVGVAIHHGRLPSPFQREVERLLNAGVLRVTVASPTLAQGLNLNAAVLLVPSLYRSGVLLQGEEFANVAGRAGRAFVDVEGLIVHVMHQPERWRINAWKNLVASARARTLSSGLVQIIDQVLRRLAATGLLRRDDAYEFLVNARDGWQADIELGEGDEPIGSLVEKLDATVLGLVEALDANSDQLPGLLDEALAGSLWARQIARRPEIDKDSHSAVLRARAALIWRTTTPEQRRSHFAMGVGLEAGLAIDAMADELGALLDAADLASIQGAADDLASSLALLAERLLTMRPFISDGETLPDNWKAVLKAWVAGHDVGQIGVENMRFVEDGLAYRLVWALEAVRTRRASLGWTADIVEGGAAASLQTGLPQMTMALLVRAGLPSRIAAMEAISQTGAAFFDGSGLREWLESNEIAAFTDEGSFPTPATAAIWTEFRREALSGATQEWTTQTWYLDLAKPAQIADLHAGERYRVEVGHNGECWITTAAFERVALLAKRIRDPKPSLFSAEFDPIFDHMAITRVGRMRATWVHG